MSTSESSEPDGYDVILSYVAADSDWARRIAHDLSRFGLRCFTQDDFRVGDSWLEARMAAIRSAVAYVVLWTSDAARSTSSQHDVRAFEEAIAEIDGRLLVPLMLGTSIMRGSLPPALRNRQAVVISDEVASEGATTESKEWQDTIAMMAGAIVPLVDRLGQPSTERDTPQFSRSARLALTFAARLLGDEPADSARLRTAALIGAIRASMATGLTPTTGDVARLIVGRVGESQLADKLDEAGLALDLEPLGETPSASPLSIGMLRRSGVRPLLELAAEAQRRTGAGRVSLRHVLAVGVHPDVPAEVMAPLGVTMAELREHWRASIARTWPDEPPDGWDAILAGDRVPSVPGPGAPPSARVHADRWTTEDRLDYGLYAKAIAEFIRHPEAKPPMVISVQAPWGQGKTSLMRMVQADLDPRHPDLCDEPRERLGGDRPATTFGELSESLDGDVPLGDVGPPGIRTVWFNAWKYQSTEQIWAGLAHAILAQLPSRLPRVQREKFWLRLQQRRIDPAAVRREIHRAALERFLPRVAGRVAGVIGVGLVVALGLVVGGLPVPGVGAGGVGLLAAGVAARRAWTTSHGEALKRPLEGAYQRYVRQPDYESRLGYLHLVEEDMGGALDLLTREQRPAVIFIDDLDRCAPSKIGEVIEAVNLFLAGEYPNCAFVIGVDAEVIAASMEVVHAPIIDKLGDRRGELGWRFMDKFVQLPFVVPRLNSAQREGYMRALFTTPSPAIAEELKAQAEQLRRDVDTSALTPAELARRAGELNPKLAEVDPEQARGLGEAVIAAGAQAFSDSDGTVVEALAAQTRFLSDNPRTIKRAVNLYRFHSFVAFARQVSTLPLAFATPSQIGRWIVVIVRWPHFVRWLQTQRDSDEGLEDAAAAVVGLASEAADVGAFADALAAKGISASWAQDAELFEFLRDAVDPDLALDRAAARGLW